MYCSLVVKNDVSYILRYRYATEFCTKGEKLWKNVDVNMLPVDQSRYIVFRWWQHFKKGNKETVDNADSCQKINVVGIIWQFQYVLGKSSAHCVGKIRTSQVCAEWFHMISAVTRNEFAWQSASEMWLFQGKTLILCCSWLPVMSLVSDIITLNQNYDCLETKACPDWRNFMWCIYEEKWSCYCFFIPKTLFFSTGTAEGNCEWWVLCKH